jgi:surface antigen
MPYIRQLTMRMLFLLLLLISQPAFALYEGLQCVPYARAVSGIEIRGDAHTWWDQAQGRFDRGSTPRVGAVMAFKPYGPMRLGHVAAVRKIIDSRTLLISHANWSTIGGVRGHIEDDVRVADTSPENDWSEVQVWYTPNAALGTTRWPVHGFIYSERKRTDRDIRFAVAGLTSGYANLAAPPPAQAKPQKPYRFGAALQAEIDDAAQLERLRSAAGETRIDVVAASAVSSDPIADLLSRAGR